ncbi:nuclear transport factor 2 family protein [Streptomyces sp. NPDC048290]|uniref:nuclear transport factor 2 family protein n=1 Tax=Streptomyces sp. NPDC048290 TaxID=3155811 RepID=UPI00343D8A36
MSTDTDTPRAVAGQFVERLGKQDQHGIQELFAPEIDWHVPGSDKLPWTGSRTRREEVAPYFTTMWPHYVPGESRVVLERTIVEGTDVVLLATFSHVIATSGKRFTTPASLHLVIEDGQIVQLHLYEDTLIVDQAFHGPGSD